MSKHKERNAAKKAVIAKQKEVDDQQSVKMKFKEDKFYNDLNVPLYEKDKVYEIKGADMIQRWVRRGGEIVEGELEFPEAKVNVSEVSENKYSEENPFGSDAKVVEDKVDINEDQDNSSEE